MAHQSFDYQARPISTEYEERQLEPQPSPPYVPSPAAQPRDDGGLPDLVPSSPIDPSHKYGSAYEATLNGSDGRQTMVGSPGLESVHHMETEKEAYRPGPHMYDHGSLENSSRPQQEQQRRRICGIPLWLLVTLVTIFIALAVGLGAGLGVGLQHHKSSQSSSSSTAPKHHPHPAAPTTNPAYFSTSGAFNGSGIALATESFGQESYGTVVVYFQHWTGQIRNMQLTQDGTWVGGDETSIVATDARNGTPIAAVAYAMNYVSTWHIFYIDQNSILQEVINGNTTNHWELGPLGSFGFKAMDDSNVGLQGCWAGYRPGGQINAVPIAGTGHNYTDTSQTEGINLWYGADPTTLRSVGWTYGTSTWTKKESLTGFNAHAGIGCYSWGPGTITYLMASDLQDTVNIWWKDLNKTAIANSTHPVGSWTNSSVAIPNSFQNTSLGYTDFLYAQDSALNLVGYNVSWNAEHTSFVPNDNFAISNDEGLAGTRMTVTAVPNESGGQTLLVFNQVNGSDVTEYIRDLVQGQWTSYTLPIPQQ